jgi:hypothetical protein
MGFRAKMRSMTSIGDANADGHPDLAVITPSGEPVALLRQ